MTPLPVISSQILNNFEKRMTTSVSSSLVSLARDIDDSWAPEPMSMIKQALFQWRRRLSTTIIQFNETIIRESARFVIENVNVKQDELDFIINFIRPELRTYGPRRAAMIERFLRDRIAATIARTGSTEEARQAILRILRDRSYAERIARTEAHTALERGSFEAARSFNLNIQKQWVSREDLAVRAPHAIANGQTVALDEAFQVGGEGLMYPGDPDGSPRNTVNCRCTVRYILP